ncbi:flagellar basal body L-ring protein FlgH [Candidatus Liberibacter americanus]|uniref:Flagellar L-ring protein n=1 Tax=Candidatus Liberibacter americanus str. Sao Paulo TaxID=1261131 RepID=U6B3X7_9HYPH|nr:flagellar basal body L-ring protein FlgH [Candidatus Liberibacter americanus]AHA27645.1 Flagellar basal body L-ring protein [Candidatus Liberibacter americanus str. Sao Paulo]EMS36354.1 flagellar basal body L-ring protein [Candidatus Liberibacter americanus PW_SP]
MIIIYYFAILVNFTLLFGCQGNTFSKFYGIPSMSPIGSDLNNYNQKILSNIYFNNYRPIKKSYSLWRDSQSALFKDSRAINVGDILTVNIRIDNKATFDNKTGRSRNNSIGKKISGGFSFLGVKSPSMDADINYDANSASAGKGSISRAERLELLIAAIVVKILDNGNLVISGSQEVRVNDEIRILNVTGLVRPQDVNAQNSISYDKIAEARISYGGIGRSTTLQQAPLGQRIIDEFSPL